MTVVASLPARTMANHAHFSFRLFVPCLFTVASLSVVPVRYCFAEGVADGNGHPITDSSHGAPDRPEPPPGMANDSVVNDDVWNLEHSSVALARKPEGFASNGEAIHVLSPCVRVMIRQNLGAGRPLLDRRRRPVRRRRPRRGAVFGKSIGGTRRRVRKGFCLRGRPRQDRSRASVHACLQKRIGNDANRQFGLSRLHYNRTGTGRPFFF